MPKLETALFGIGTAIAKSVLKTRMADPAIVPETSDSVLDLLKSKDDDAFAERKTRNLIETAGIRIAESLIPLFESETTGQKEESRRAVAEAVEMTINRARLAPGALGDVDLAPHKVFAILREAAPDLRGSFDPMETVLYDRILSEASQQIVDIGAQLPMFTECTFAEVLKREGQLLEATHHILAEADKIRVIARLDDPEIDSARFEVEYRRAVVRNLDSLEHFGSGMSPANRRHNLSAAYIMLTVDQKRHSPARGWRNEIYAEWVMKRSANPGTSRLEDEPIPVDDCLAHASRLFLRGAAGTGKTTLLQWVAVRSALRDFAAPLDDWNDTIPFFIRLGQCAEDDLPAPRDFINRVSPAVAETMPDGWVEKQLRSGRGLVLVDGMNEVSEGRRQEVHEWLRDLTAAYGDCRFIVTGHLHMPDGWLRDEGFEEATAQPMDLPEIRRFIAHWHESAGKERQDAKEMGELALYATYLQDAVGKNRAVRNLASTPLLCAMLCALNRDRSLHVPKDRVQLYRECIQVQLDERKKAAAAEDGVPNLSMKHQELLLQDLAYYMQMNEWASIRTDTAAVYLSRWLTTMPGLRNATAIEEIIKFLIDRTGLIRESVLKGRIDFIHPTFQEFFAAQAILYARNLGVLVKSADDPRWREIIVLAAGLAGDVERDEIVQSLIRRGDSLLDKSRRYQIHLLAAACLETAVHIGSTLKTEIDRRLARLVPPRSADDAPGLATAGDLAVPHLAAYFKADASIAAAAVRTLSLIGSEMAMEAIRFYTSDASQPVIRELVRGWDHFDRNAYARTILSQVTPVITDLHLAGEHSLVGLQYVKSFQRLELRDVTDIGILSGLTNLTSLVLFNCNSIQDIDVLSGLVNLKSLELSFCRNVTDLSGLSNLSNLTELTLWNCPRLMDIGPLSKLHSLTSLDLSYCFNLEDLQPLENLHNLTFLSLRGSHNLRGHFEHLRRSDLTILEP